MGAGVLYLGIDEAGYGPRVGPLCVGASLFSIDGIGVAEATSSDAPDLWSLLSHGVRRGGQSDDGRVVVDDSKRLLRRHRGRADLSSLELGVRAFLSLAGHQADSWESIFESLRCGWCEEWSGLASPELAHTPTVVAIRTNPIRRCAREAGVRCLGVRCASVDACEFNRRLREHGTKSSLSFAMVCDHIERALEMERPLSIVVDRQGGRTSYQRLLRERFPWLGVSETSRSPERSVYSLTQHGGPDCHLEFRTRAEEASMAVALASMSAKLVREVRMHHFNSYWCDRIPELKPTAGYGLDARRWIEDVTGCVADDELARVVRTR
ncbi:MAG: hypothetical protein ACF8GE_01960 [Phycisphaerales bacterium JB043]